MLAVLLLIPIAPAVVGQDAAPAAPSFEVASIKRTVPAERQRSGFIPTPGRFTAEDVPASALIGYAYRGVMDEMRGQPAWSQSERYDVLAPVPPNTTPDSMALMVRALLVERFRLAAHIEREERDVLAMVRAQPDAPLPEGFEPVDVDCAARAAAGEPPAPLENGPEGALPLCRGTDNGRMLNSGGLPLTFLTSRLRSAVGRQVLDETGLTGAYRFKVNYSLTRPDGSQLTDEYPEITTAIREQLGLRLVSKKAMVNILVVDRFERPTEN